MKKFNLQLAACQTFWKSVVKKFNLLMQSAARQIFLKFVVKKFNLQSAARQTFWRFDVKKFNLLMQSAARQTFFSQNAVSNTT